MEWESSHFKVVYFPKHLFDLHLNRHLGKSLPPHFIAGLCLCRLRCLSWNGMLWEWLFLLYSLLKLVGLKKSGLYVHYYLKYAPCFLFPVAKQTPGGIMEIFKLHSNRALGNQLRSSLGGEPLFLHSCLNPPAMDLIWKKPKTRIQSRKEFFLLNFCSGRSLAFSTENIVVFSVAWDFTHFLCLVPVAFLLCSLWLQHAWLLCDDHVDTRYIHDHFVLNTFFFCLHK